MAGGRPFRIPGVHSTHAIFFRVTPDEYRDLKEIADQNGMKVAEMVREATNEFVADCREKRVFSQVMRPRRTLTRDLREGDGNEEAADSTDGDLHRRSIVR